MRAMFRDVAQLVAYASGGRVVASSSLVIPTLIEPAVIIDCWLYYLTYCRWRHARHSLRRLELSMRTTQAGIIPTDGMALKIGPGCQYPTKNYSSQAIFRLFASENKNVFLPLQVVCRINCTDVGRSNSRRRRQHTHHAHRRQTDRPKPNY